MFLEFLNMEKGYRQAFSMDIICCLDKEDRMFLSLVLAMSSVKRKISLFEGALGKASLYH
jgi:hypothetical protein